MIIWIMDSNISTTPVTQQSGMTTNQSATIDLASSAVLGNSIDKGSPNKTYLKFLIAFSGLILLAVVGGVMLATKNKSGSSFKSVAQCFDTESTISEQNLTEMSFISTNDEKRKFFCRTDEESFYRLIACLENAMAKNSIEKDIITAFPSYTELLLNTVTTHNSTCPESKISIP